MALTPCRGCKNPVASSAKTCPKCGAKNPSRSTVEQVASAVVAVFIGIFVWTTCTSSDSEPAAPTRRFVTTRAAAATTTTTLCQQSPFTSRELLMLNELSGAGRLVALAKGVDDDGDGVAESDWCSARAGSILIAGEQTLDLARTFCEAIGEAMREAGIAADEAAEIILLAGNAGADERRFVRAMQSSYLCSNGQYTPGAYPG